MKNNKLDPAKIDPAAIAHVINNPPTRYDTLRVSSVPIPVIVGVLTGNKCGGKQRRRLKHALSKVVLRPQTPPIDPAVKIAVKLQKLSLAQLLRRRSQSARDAATAKYILAKMSPNSMFRAGVLREQTHQLSLLKQVNAEIQVRTEIKVVE